MLHRLSDFKGFTLAATDGQIGKIDHFYFDDQHWTIRYLIVNTGSWLLKNYVMISPLAILGINDAQRVIHLSLSREQIQNGPDIDVDKPISRQKEADFYDYYRWPYYWTDAGVDGTQAFSSSLAESLREEASHNAPEIIEGRLHVRPSDPHLQSTKTVRGYRVHAEDKVFGEIEDLIIEDSNWVIRYLVIDTVKYWPSRWVLMSPLWVDAIQWNDRTVRTPLTAREIQTSPDYHRSESITRAYEIALHNHYRRRPYWTEKEISELKEGIKEGLRKAV